MLACDPLRYTHTLWNINDRITYYEWTTVWKKLPATLQFNFNLYSRTYDRTVV
jgi:hypothetical protein